MYLLFSIHNLTPIETLRQMAFLIQGIGNCTKTFKISFYENCFNTMKAVISITVTGIIHAVRPQFVSKGIRSAG